MPLGGQEQFAGNLQGLLGGNTGFMGGAPPPRRRSAYAAEQLNQSPGMNWGSLTPRRPETAPGLDTVGGAEKFAGGAGEATADDGNLAAPAIAALAPPPQPIGGRSGLRGRAPTALAPRSAGPAAFEPPPGLLGPGAGVAPTPQNLGSMMRGAGQGGDVSVAGNMAAMAPQASRGYSAADNPRRTAREARFGRR